MARTHGRIATYKWGCRCVACRAANTAYFQGYRSSREGGARHDAAMARRARRRLQAGMARKLDLIHQLEVQLGLTPQQEVA